MHSLYILYYVATSHFFFFSFFSSFISLIADGPHSILPVVTKDLPISPRFTPYEFLSRCKFSTLTTRQPMVEIYLLTFPRFPLRKKEHQSYFGKNRTHDFRASRCAVYLLYSRSHAFRTSRIELTTSALAGVQVTYNNIILLLPCVMVYFIISGLF